MESLVRKRNPFRKRPEAVKKTTARKRTVKERVRVYIGKKKPMVIDGKVVNYDKLSLAMQEHVKEIYDARMKRNALVAGLTVFWGLVISKKLPLHFLFYFPIGVFGAMKIREKREIFSYRHMKLEKEILECKDIPEIVELKEKYKYFFVRGSDLIFTDRKGLFSLFKITFGRKRKATKSENVTE